MNLDQGPAPESEIERVRPFLEQYGLEGDMQFTALLEGANNRVYHLRQTGQEFVLKCYFQHASDPRDRFGAERAFYEFLWSRGIRQTPTPLGWDSQRRLGLFGFVKGRKLKLEEINQERVREALGFLLAINAARSHPSAEMIPPAAEACFSLAEHLACVGRRVGRLQQMVRQTDVDEQAWSFVQEQLRPAWEQVRAQIAGQTDAQTEPELIPAGRCLSPSDFGFHNALLAEDGNLRFIDFEYAGWDDPAKLVCDFFCQPELPVDLRYWDVFMASLCSQWSSTLGLPSRSRLLLPAYQIKWCCIMLNEFVQAGQARRTFAGGNERIEERKTAQLAKARQGLRTAGQKWHCKS